MAGVWARYGLVIRGVPAVRPQRDAGGCAEDGKAEDRRHG
jgi:hypothetical protein